MTEIKQFFGFNKIKNMSLQGSHSYSIVGNTEDLNKQIKNTRVILLVFQKKIEARAKIIK